MIVFCTGRVGALVRNAFALEQISKGHKGYTLLETVIALGVWVVVAASAVSLLVYTTRASTRMTVSSEMFENARASLDALVTNIQLADTIVLQTDYNNVLRQIKLTERNTSGNMEPYYFSFSQSASPGTAKYHRLETGSDNEFASHIASVALVYTADRYITVTVTTDGELSEPLTFSATVDARYKDVTVIRS